MAIEENPIQSKWPDLFLLARKRHLNSFRMSRKPSDSEGILKLRGWHTGCKWA